MATQNVALPEELMVQAQREADAQGKTVEDFVIDAVQRQLTQAFFRKVREEAEARRAGMTDEEIEEVVNRAVKEYREEARNKRTSQPH